MADATKRRRWNIEITEEDIAKAMQNDSYKCVIAQAIARTVADATKIEVDIQTIRFSRDGERLTFLTPYAAAGYIVAFDAGDEIHPFQFQLRDPIIKPSRTRTVAGRDLKAKANRIGKVRKQAARALDIVNDPASSAPERAKAEVIIAEAPAQLAEAQEALEEMRASYKTTGTKIEEDKGHRPPPKVYKTKSRMYGQRVLRVNQEDDRKHYA